MKNLTKKQVSEKLGKAESTVSNYVTDGFFPKPKANGLSVYWEEATVDAWIILSDGRKATLPPIDVDDLKDIYRCIDNIEKRK